MRSLSAEHKLTVSRAIEPSAHRKKALDLGWALLHQNIDNVADRQPRRCDHGVLCVEMRCIVLTHRSCDTTLRVGAGAATAETSFRDECDSTRRQGKRRGQSGDTGTHDDNIYFECSSVIHGDLPL
jgi:hypothetical protein